jgi:hypothetical protein
MDFRDCGFAVAARAQVKRGRGVIVIRQVVRQIGAAGAELDSHMRPPKAKQWLRLYRVPLVGGIVALAPDPVCDRGHWPRNRLLPIANEARWVGTDASIVRR